MAQPIPTGTTPAARAGEATPAARTGQVPDAERARARLCFLSLPVACAPDGTPDLSASAAGQARLAALGLGLGLLLEPAERARLGPERIARCLREAGALAPGYAAGASYEAVGGAASIGEQLEAVAAQAHAIEEAGGVPVLLPLATLSRRRVKEDEYVEVYRTLLARVNGPVILDWTGPKVRPELLDYFPGKSFERVLALDPAKVRGARFNVLDVAREARLRRELLARDQLLFTADRENLAWLLLGANPGSVPARVPAIARHTELAGRAAALGEFSHAMLAGVAPEVIAPALERLESGDVAGVLEQLSSLD